MTPPIAPPRSGRQVLSIEGRTRIVTPLPAPSRGRLGLPPVLSTHEPTLGPRMLGAAP